MLAPPPSLAAHRTRRIADELQAVLRHNVRNKLAAARNAAFYVKRKLATALESEPKAAQFLAIVDSELEAASQLLTSAHSPTPEPVAVLAATRALLAELTVPHDVVITAEGVEPTLQCDRAELQLALFELLANAIDAGARHITCAWSTDERVTTLTVTDDGAGVVDAQIARAGHLGLGLKVARRAVSHARGTLVVEATPPRGSCATLKLPA
jgi:signal transduction histidine kinase